MAKIDEIKEVLNTLRVILSITVGIVVMLISGIVRRYDVGRVDEIFWIGIVATVLLTVFIFITVNKIFKNTKEIKEL